MVGSPPTQKTYIDSFLRRIFTLMKSTLSLLVLIALCSITTAHGQTPTTRELIDQNLSILDLPTFEWEGRPDLLRSRLGIYLTPIPDDTVTKITGKSGNPPWFVIWHVMPHWSADEGGILPGDTLTALNGKPIGNAIYQNDDFVNMAVRELRAGSFITLTIRRNGTPKDLVVKLHSGKRAQMPFTTPPMLGPVRSNTWLQQTLAANGLNDWATTIHKQMRIVADQDFNTVEFAGRLNPWRLNAVTYLHHYPMRTGAYSRLIVSDLWAGIDSGGGLPGALAAAAQHLDVPRRTDDAPKIPTSVEEVTAFLQAVQSLIDDAYRPVRNDLPAMTDDLMKLLDPDSSPETELDTIKDPARKREARNDEEIRMATLFEQSDKVGFAALVRAAQHLTLLADTTWMKKFAASFTRVGRRRQASRIPGVEGDVILSWKTPLGICVIGGAGSNRYTGTFPFILDLGGDDVYNLPAALVGTARYVGDLDGDDTWLSRASAQGSGIGCVDVLVDARGNDTYRASRFSQGAGLLGIGVLADFAGDDMYTSHWCSQGAAFLGIGLLYEGGGNDSYSAGIYSQAFAYAKGFGTLMDATGNDSYRAGWEHPDELGRYPNRGHIAMSQGFGFGMRPWTTGIGTDGGIGALTDRSGDDVYASDFFSQGGSYWYALGILHDGAGADRYTAGQYSQGSGIHLSFGALLDDAGDDMYDAYHGLEQGNAHDWSAGCLEDLQGNDTYRGSTASQGTALNVSFAWLLDRTGNDQYYVNSSDTTTSQGGGNYNKPRQHGALGMLLDLGAGSDYYVDPRAVQGVLLHKGFRGFLYDDGVPEKK
jgi:hypothetical protein